MSKALSLCAALLGVALLLAWAPPARGQSTALGRPALPEEIQAWDIDLRPDGHGVPPGQGSVKAGEEIFLKQCAACHGEFGEGAGRWPVVAGREPLINENPEKTVGSYWPHVTTVFDYVRRTMPFGNAQSLSDDEVYALTAFLLYMNDLVTEDFVLSSDRMASIVLPNAAGFYDDDREVSEKHFWGREPCMMNCKTEVTIVNRARALDVTPDDKGAPKVE